jgi:hypothetical protein
MRKQKIRFKTIKKSKSASGSKKALQVCSMKIVKGWKRISNSGGFVNETTGQTLVITKKEFAAHYHVLLFRQEKTDNSEGKKMSPDFSTQAKAEDYALDWMKKHPQGTTDQ